LPGWPLKLNCGRTYALAPAQLPAVLPPTQRDVGVGLKPPSTLLLGSAGGQLCLGGAVGLLASKLLCGLGEEVLLVCLCELPAATDPPQKAERTNPAGRSFPCRGGVAQPAFGVLAPLDSLSK
jgi:hypothetical protein